MFKQVMNWFTATTPKQPPHVLEAMLMERDSAEIAARLLRRAELHGQGNSYLQRCAVLDRVAAENIRKLEGYTGRCMSDWLDRRVLCLRLLREAKK